MLCSARVQPVRLLLRCHLHGAGQGAPFRPLQPGAGQRTALSWGQLLRAYLYLVFHKQRACR